MSAAISVDTVNETLNNNFLDDKDDTGAPPPVGVEGTATFDSTLLSLSAPLAIVPGAATPYGDVLSAPLTVVIPTGGIAGPTVVTVTVVLTGPGGAAIFEADGATPFGQPAPFAITVNPGAAVGSRLSITP
jgi:hypothetical protein